MKFLLKKSS